MQQGIKTAVSMMLTLILYVTLILSISFVGSQSRKLYRNYERQDTAKSVTAELLTLHNIASPAKEYTGSDVVNIISENGEAYQYILSVGSEEYSIYRDSEDYFKAKKEAQLNLKSGSGGKDYILLGDMQNLLDTRLWSANYLIDDVLKGRVDGKYKATFLVEDTVTSIWEDKDKLTGQSLGPEDVVGKVYRIKYTYQ